MSRCGATRSASTAWRIRKIRDKAREMCGICGLFNLNGAPADVERVTAMQGRLGHRGPDDEGRWSDGPVSFGFRRLSILDLEGGHQPMLSADGQLAVVFNGEIYNHPQIKTELESAGVAY